MKLLLPLFLKLRFIVLKNIDSLVIKIETYLYIQYKTLKRQTVQILSIAIANFITLRQITYTG